MPVNKGINEKLYWAYRGNTDPADAIRQMRREGYSVDEVRQAIDSLIREKKIEYAEGSWLRAEVDMMSLASRTNPSNDAHSSRVQDSEEYLFNMQDRVRAAFSKKGVTENPRRTVQEGGQADKAMNAFFQGRNYASSVTKSIDLLQMGKRDESQYNKHTGESTYRLWDVVIAEMSRPINGKMWKFEMTTAGYNTPTTFRRLENLIKIGANYHPELADERIHFGMADKKLVVTRNGETWNRHPMTGMWTIDLKPRPYWHENVIEPIGEIAPDKSERGIIMQRIEEIEAEMYRWQHKNDPGARISYEELARKIGKYDELGTLTLKLMLMKPKRENPERVYWRD